MCVSCWSLVICLIGVDLKFKNNASQKKEGNTVVEICFMLCVKYQRNNGTTTSPTFVFAALFTAASFSRRSQTLTLRIADAALREAGWRKQMGRWKILLWASSVMSWYPSNLTEIHTVFSDLVSVSWLFYATHYWHLNECSHPQKKTVSFHNMSPLKYNKIHRTWLFYHWKSYMTNLCSGQTMKTFGVDNI